MAWGLTTSIRVRDMQAALDFYTAELGFSLKRGTAEEGNCSLEFGESHIMLETPGTFYSPAYNDAIRSRIGTPSASALYIEAEDLNGLWKRVSESEVKVMDPLAKRDWGQSEFTVEDPDGTWLTFWHALSASTD